ncbi:MAG: TlpA family protein disulfide reductase [Desulfuromonadales bacterium]|nr:TlpA family protein disulfide reductase [Desulfuromonadales bacterium]
MKHARLLSLPALLLLVMSMWPASLYALPRSGQATPHFKATSTSGQAISLDNYRGYVLVIDFFATWCVPCRASVPHIVEMNRKYGKQGLQVLGLNVDDEGDRVTKVFSDELRINYPLATASEKVQADFGVRSVPVMFVIDKKGIVAEVYRGFNDEIGRSMEILIKRLLAEK